MHPHGFTLIIGYSDDMFVVRVCNWCWSRREPEAPRSCTRCMANTCEHLACGCEVIG